MIRFQNPRDAVLGVQCNAPLWPGADERFTGYGVMGVPFAGGHYLALRHIAESSIGPGFTRFRLAAQTPFTNVFEVRP